MNRRNSYLKSRSGISGGLEKRFFLACRKICAWNSMRYHRLEQSSGNEAGDAHTECNLTPNIASDGASRHAAAATSSRRISERKRLFSRVTAVPRIRCRVASAGTARLRILYERADFILMSAKVETTFLQDSDRNPDATRTYVDCLLAGLAPGRPTGRRTSTPAECGVAALAGQGLHRTRRSLEQMRLANGTSRTGLHSFGTRDQI